MSTVTEIFTKAVANHADRIAVREGDHTLTFAELSDQVHHCVAVLQSAGVQPGDRVLDLQTNSITMLVTDLAIRCGGFVRVALNYRLSQGDWDRIARDSQAAVLIYDPALVPEGTDWLAASTLRLNTDEVVGRGRAGLVNLPSVGPDTLCGLHYSSGTTGAPKGAIRTHGNWAASVAGMKHGVLPSSVRPQDVYLHAGPMTHTSGLFILPFLEAGASQVIMPKWDPVEALALMERWDVTHTAMVPTMVNRLAAVSGVEEVTQPRLKMLGYAGAPMPPAAVERAFARITQNLVQYYGLVEATPPVASLGIDAHRDALAPSVEPAERKRILGSIGKRIEGVEVEIWDDKEQVQELGQIGELMTRGAHLMQGYWGAAGARADVTKVFRHGWLATGDMAIEHPDGYISLADRRGDMIISGGYNIYPTEIENVLATFPGVADSSVVGITDDDWGQRVVAFVRVTPGAHLDPQALRDHCADVLATFKKPKEIILLDDLPVNANGKVSKVILRDNYEELARVHV